MCSNGTSHIDQGLTFEAGDCPGGTERAVSEHLAHEERKDEEAQPLVPAEGAKERSEPHDRAAEVEREKHDGRADDPRYERDRSAEDVIDDVLGAPELEREVLAQA